MSQETKEEGEECPAASPSSSSRAAFFALSCALAALHRAPGGVAGCGLGHGARRCRWSRARELALREEVAALELEAGELRSRRTEDAKANEKVAGIFAAHEQRWLAERGALRRQAHAVAAAARARERKDEEAAEELRHRLEEQQRAAEEEIKRREEAEEKLRASELAAEALLEDLAGERRQLEAELIAAVARREEAAELSAEAERLRRDAEHKDKILSAMLRKSKVDMEDREMLVREVKMCKARRKQAELEAERWRRMWESRGHRRGSRSSARCAAAMADHPGCSDKLPHDVAACAQHDTKILFVDHVAADGPKNRQPAAKDLATVDCVDRYPSHVNDKPVVEEYEDLQEWFQMETERYTTMIRHRHSAEIEAFTEQLRLKDGKLEAFRWRAVSTDIEAARLRRRLQELEARLSQHEQRSTALEALLLDRESENTSLNEQLMALQERAFDAEISTAGDEEDDDDDARERCIPCSPVKIIQRAEPREADIRLFPCPEGTEIADFRHEIHDRAEITKLADPASPENSKEAAFDVEETEPYDVTVLDDHQDRCEIEEWKVACTDQSTTGSEEVASAAAVALAAPPEQRPSACKMDIHALAVSYKIKRLKQQLLVLEKLAAAGGKEAKPSSNEADADADAGGGGGRQQPRRYQMMTSFLSKHIKRYQSLEDKIDDLCARMEESKRSSGAREREREWGSAALGRFLEETFQLQRYMVATGQKLLEMQSRIAPTLARGGGGDDNGDGVDLGRLMDVAGALLRDVQRGLEVRIARIIGDLEGTLAFHGILQNAF